MPAAGETLPARDLIVKLGGFLAELTADRSAREVHADRSAAEVHAEIARQLSEPGHDRRLVDAAEADRFTTMWTALGSGSSLPPAAWQCVVLPTVVAFSSPNSLKANLELATSRWMSASTAINDPSQASAAADIEPDRESDHEIDYEPEPEPEPVDNKAFPVSDQGDDRPSTVDMSPARRRRRRRAAAIAAGSAAALIAAALVWWTQMDPATDGTRTSVPPPLPTGGSARPASATPGASSQPEPSAPQLAGNPAPAPPSTQPVPAPTWSGPGPMVAPEAPRNLNATNATDTTITLNWQPPAEAGTGGLAYYKIWRDGTYVGWTAQDSATVLGLAPATSYTFTVTAHNGAGAASPASNPVTATTRPSQPQQPTPTRTGPPAGKPLLSTEPEQKPINLGRSFIVAGSGWPCTASATINVYLGGKLVAIPGVNAQGAFRTTIAVDATDPQAPTVAVIGGSEPLTLTRGTWVLTAQLPAQPSCTGAAVQSIQIEFRAGPQ